MDRGVTVRSWNYGMLAYNTTQEYSLLVSDVLPAKPDVVVLAYFLNDPEPPFFEVDPATGDITVSEENMFWTEMPSWPDTFVFRLRLAALAWQVSHRLQAHGRIVAYYDRLFSDENPHWAYNRESLIGIVDACREYDIPLVVVTLPVLYRLGRGYPFRHLHERVKEIVIGAGGRRVTFVDALPLFDGTPSRTLWVHPTDQHPNEAAHRLVADTLAKTLAPIVRKIGGT